MQSLVGALSHLHAQHVVHSEAHARNLRLHEATQHCFLINLNHATFAPSSPHFPVTVLRFSPPPATTWETVAATSCAPTWVCCPPNHNLVSLYYLCQHALLRGEPLSWSQLEWPTGLDVLTRKLRDAPPAVLVLSKAAHTPQEHKAAVSLLRAGSAVPSGSLALALDPLCGSFTSKLAPPRATRWYFKLFYRASPSPQAPCSLRAGLLQLRIVWVVLKPLARGFPVPLLSLFSLAAVPSSLALL